MLTKVAKRMHVVEAGVIWSRFCHICRQMPNASERNWCHKVCDLHAAKSKHFEKPRLSQTSFIIVHFADRVEYQIEGFVEKNRDTVLDEQIRLLKASTVCWSYRWCWYSILFVLMDFVMILQYGLMIAVKCYNVAHPDLSWIPIVWQTLHYCYWITAMPFFLFLPGFI